MFDTLDAEDLDYRTRMLTGCIPPYAVTRLLELGHADEVERQAARGEWFCALAVAEDATPQRARAVLAPFVATGWWKAAEALARLLERWGQGEEAIALVRPHVAAGDRSALEFLGRLLARHGRAAEAFELLRPHVENWSIAAALVDVAEACGRDADAVALLQARIDVAVRVCEDPACQSREVRPFNAIGLLAGIRERQGRVDEAIALLHTRHGTSVNGGDQLADLLARHDRVEELRAYAAADSHGHAAKRLAELLEQRGDVAGGIEVYRRLDDAVVPWICRAAPLAELLMRHGRIDEAVEVLRPLIVSGTGHDDCLTQWLCTEFAEQGRAADGLTFLDELKADRGEEGWEFFGMRLPLLAELDRHEEAIELARAHPEGDTWYGVLTLAGLLAGAGRTEEAVELLTHDEHTHTYDLSTYLLDLGRVTDAITVMQRDEPSPWGPPQPSDAADGPPL
ncbi:tetratricopeptide repeat protein [Dactylosporangium sp. CS-047395]|uniref:tetratricopeptide repeat protein n=1 Tax=Dactylosporangium sp. CS-047395 TaxID=3239936 RepID=UPI003D918D81